MPAASSHPNPPPPADAAQAILAVSRLVAAGEGRADLQRVRDSLVAESRALLGVRWAALLALKDGGKRVLAVGGDARGGFQTPEHPALALLVARRTPVLHLEPAMEATALVEGLIGDGVTAGSALLLRLPLVSEDHVLVLADPRADAFGPDAIAAAKALADAGAEALARRRAADVEATRATRHSALARAAATLNASLDLETVLSRICEEATRVLGGDCATVFRGASDGLVMEAGYGLPSELIGFELRPGQGLSGKVLASGRPMLTNDYGRVSGLGPDSPFSRVRSAMAVPMRWGGTLCGVIAVGHVRPVEVTPEQLTVLETLAELAAVAYANASAHAGLTLAARTDGLTGCLNHAALHESLAREIERAKRSGHPPMSLIMFDLDDFKSVNDVHGHLVGDEMLRRVGWALRDVTRPYDSAARYGGDEFAVLSLDADEDAGVEIARRALDRVSLAIGELSPSDTSRATAGVAAWAPGVAPTELVARADRALLYGKHEGARGSAVPLSLVPAWFRPARFFARKAGAWIAG